MFTREGGTLLEISARSGTSQTMAAGTEPAKYLQKGDERCADKKACYFSLSDTCSPSYKEWGDVFFSPVVFLDTLEGLQGEHWWKACFSSFFQCL